MELLILVAQTSMVGLLAGWLITGAYENIRAPAVNRDLVRDVCSMRSIETEEPEIYQLVKRNRLKSSQLPGALFSIIVVFETIVAVALAIATILMAFAVVGAVSTAYAQLFAGWATLGFVLIWGSFLVGGNWFHYWVTHQGSQHTHYFMTIWGIVTFLVVIQ